MKEDQSVRNVEIFPQLSYLHHLWQSLHKFKGGPFLDVIFRSCFS